MSFTKVGKQFSACGGSQICYEGYTVKYRDEHTLVTLLVPDRKVGGGSSMLGTLMFF
jgi:hypothetical protein